MDFSALILKYIWNALIVVPQSKPLNFPFPSSTHSNHVLFFQSSQFRKSRTKVSSQLIYMRVFWILFELIKWPHHSGNHFIYQLTWSNCGRINWRNIIWMRRLQPQKLGYLYFLTKELEYTTYPYLQISSSKNHHSSTPNR